MAVWACQPLRVQKSGIRFGRFLCRHVFIAGHTLCGGQRQLGLVGIEQGCPEKHGLSQSGADRQAFGLDIGLSVPAQAFLSSDAAPALTADFYPGTTCQVYPQAFGLRELAGQFTAGWNYFNTHTPGWETGSHDPFPWAILGYVAALRGQTGLASAQLATIDKLFAANRRLVTINELGFYQRTKSVLAGNLSA